MTRWQELSGVLTPGGGLAKGAERQVVEHLERKFGGHPIPAKPGLRDLVYDAGPDQPF